MNPRLLRCVVVLVTVLGIVGCIGPRPTSVPSTDIQFTVQDADSGSPISGANVFLIYEGPNGQVKKKGPFLSDAAGHGRVLAKKEVFWVTWSQAYFAGGYLRKILVQASGYQDMRYLGSQINHDLGLGSPVTFLLKPRQE
jgi:hypothetical protein